MNGRESLSPYTPPAELAKKNRPGIDRFAIRMSPKAERKFSKVCDSLDIDSSVEPIMPLPAAQKIEKLR